MSDVDKHLEDYLDRDEPTVRVVRSHSSPTIEMQAEALTMCIDILNSVPEPIDATEKVLWKSAQQALRSAKTEITLNDVDSEWQPAPAPSRSSQRVKAAGFTYHELKDLRK